MNNLPAIKQEAKLILGKSNSLIKITNKILATRSTALATALQYKPFVQTGHMDYIRSVTFSPDDKTALLISSEEYLTLWDVSTGKEIRTFKDYTSYIHSVAFSPDGKTMISGCHDKTLKLWDVSTGKEIRIFKGHDDIVNRVAFSPDGKTVISGSHDKTSKLWDVSTGEVIRSFQSYKPIAFSPDGKTMISGGAFGALDLELWEISTGEVIRTFEGNTWIVASVTFSPDGKTALFGSLDKTLKLWDISTGREIRTFKGGHISKSIVFSPDGKTVISLSNDRTAILWDISTGEVIRIFEGYMYEGIAFSPDGKTVISGGDIWDVSTGKEILMIEGGERWIITLDEKMALLVFKDDVLHLWDVSTRKELWTFEKNINFISDSTLSHNGKITFFHKALILCRTFKKRTSSIDFLTFNADGKTAFSFGLRTEDRALTLWDISTGKKIRSFEEYIHYIDSVKISRDGKIVFSESTVIADYADSLKTIVLWDIGTGKVIRTLRYSAEHFSLSPDLKKVISLTSDGTLTLWDIDTVTEIRTFDEQNGHIESVAFSPNGETVLTGSRDDTLKLWDVETGKEIRTFERLEEYEYGYGSKDSIGCVAFSPDGRTALSVSGNSLKLWDIDSGAKIREFDGYIYYNSSVIFSPDGKTALTPKNSDYPQLWDINTGRVIKTFEGIETATFSPDGKIIIARNFDGIFKLWNIATNTEIQIFEEELSTTVNSIALSPDGKTALSGSKNGRLKLWDISTGSEIRSIFTFEDEEWVTITPEGYFEHSKNGRQYLNVLTSPMSAIAIDDVTYKYYYRPNEFSINNSFKFSLAEIDIDEDEIPF